VIKILILLIYTSSLLFLLGLNLFVNTFLNDIPWPLFFIGVFGIVVKITALILSIWLNKAVLRLISLFADIVICITPLYQIYNVFRMQDYMELFINPVLLLTYIAFVSIFFFWYFRLIKLQGRSPAAER